MLAMPPGRPWLTGVVNCGKPKGFAAACIIPVGHGAAPAMGNIYYIYYYAIMAGFAKFGGWKNGIPAAAAAKGFAPHAACIPLAIYACGPFIPCA